MHDHEHKITDKNEIKTLIVVILTVITMIAEIIFGYITHSMALLADGFHMGTHALALGLAFLAYVLIRKLNNTPHFPQGTTKIGVLAAYTSSLFLGLTGVWIIIEAVHRLIKPVQIQFNEAILVAVIGLVVNAICIFVMDCKSKQCKEEHDGHEEEEDYNFKAAYYHIMSDLLTSVLAIFALLAGKYFNIFMFDALIGILGGLLILGWAISLLRSTVVVLIDMKK